jgi:hypothetical protein
LQCGKEDVSGEEGLGNGHPSVGTTPISLWLSTSGSDLPVIERSLEPLHRRGHQGVLVDHHEVPGKGAGSLATHWISLGRSAGIQYSVEGNYLVGHGGTAESQYVSPVICIATYLPI